jgi:triacylglycerol lipase
VHCIYTPFDLMIVPASSSVLPAAHSVHSLPVPLHRWMIRDPRVLDLVAQTLTRA